MIHPWKRVSTRVRGDYRIFSVREDHSRSPVTGAVSPFYVLQSGDWVNCLPVTADGKLVCIRQYRHGSRSIHLEIPGGLAEKGEPPMAAARREMLEETGYDAEEMILLGSMHPNPAILNNTCYFFLARNAALERAQNLDRNEDIEVELVATQDIADMVRSGAFAHGITVAGLYYLDLFFCGGGGRR